MLKRSEKQNAATEFGMLCQKTKVFISMYEWNYSQRNFEAKLFFSLGKTAVIKAS